MPGMALIHGREAFDNLSRNDFLVRTVWIPA